MAALLDHAAKRDMEFERRVARIVGDVRLRGDRALLSYARRHDGLIGSPEITRTEMERGAASVASDVRRAIAAAARNIRHVARRQMPRGWTTSPVAGVTIEQRVTPLERVGWRVPCQPRAPTKNLPLHPTPQPRPRAGRSQTRDDKK